MLLAGIVEPVEHEKDALNPPDIAQSAGDRVLTQKTRQLAEHDRGADSTGADRRGKLQRLAPILFDRADVDRAGNQRT